MYQGRPSHQSLGTTLTDKWFLTHASWASGNHDMGYRPSNETGVRRVIDGEISNVDFWLIEHGWPDHEEAGRVILRMLERGDDIWTINDFMDRLKDRRRRFPRNKATVL